MGGACGEGGAGADGASLTVEPAMATSFIGLGMPSDPVVFSVHNAGCAASGSFQFHLTGSGYFVVSSNTCADPLPAGASCQFDVVFDAPGGAGSAVATLVVSADGLPDGEVTIPLEGDAV